MQMPLPPRRPLRPLGGSGHGFCAALDPAAIEQLVHQADDLADFGIAEMPAEQGLDVLDHETALHRLDGFHRGAHEHHAALVATVAGVGGTLPIVLAAAQAVGATPEQASSWVSGLGIATALSALILSVRYRMPIITAWSTPGAEIGRAHV